MDKSNDSLVGMLFGRSVVYMRRFLFRVISAGPVPNHIAFILDGNRRFSRKWNLGEGMGHRAGFLSLMSLMKYCYELGIKYMTIYAFSIDNFKRKPHEVKYVMDLMLEKIEGMLKEQSIVKQYGVRVYFIGNLKLLDENVRKAAELAMKATEHNNNCILLICVAYTSTDEIVHSAQACCEELSNKFQGQQAKTKGEVNKNEKQGNQPDHLAIRLSDIEKNLYMGLAPDVDILVRTSGETRLSNFLLWQTWNGLLYSPKALWPEIGLPHLVWALLNFQRAYGLFEKRKKQH